VLGSSIYFIRKGRALRRNYPASSDPLAQRMRKQFIVVGRSQPIDATLA
jgi:hypothetical protein